jgi:hypothetical protein
LLDKALLGRFIEKILENHVKEFTDLLPSIKAVYFVFERKGGDKEEKKIWNSLQMNREYSIIDQVLRFGKTSYQLYKSVLIITMSVDYYKKEFDSIVDLYKNDVITKRNVD